MAIINALKAMKLRMKIATLTKDIGKLILKRKNAYDVKIARKQKEKATLVKQLTSMGVPVEDDCDDKKKTPKK